MSFDSVKEWLWKTANDYRGIDGIKKRNYELESMTGDEPGLLAEVASEADASVRGWLQGYKYKGAAMIMATDAEVARQCAYGCKFRNTDQGETSLAVQTDKLIAYAEKHPLIEVKDKSGQIYLFSEVAGCVTQFCPDILRYVNMITDENGSPLSPNQKKVIICAQGVLDAYPEIVDMAEKCRHATGPGTDEARLEYQMSHNPMETPAIYDHVRFERVRHQL